MNGRGRTYMERVKQVYDLAKLNYNFAQPWDRQAAIYVGERQISEQCASSAKAWRSAWEKIEASREASHGN